MKGLFKIFTMSLVLLALVPGVLATSISPDPAYTTDSLTCVVGNPSSYVFRWYQGANFLFEGQNLDSSNTVKSVSYTCEVYVDLFGDLVLADTVSATVQNSPPLISSVSFAGEPYYSNSTVSVTAVASDADGDSFNLTYVFRNASTVLRNSSTNTLDCNATACPKGDNISVEVYGFDGADYSSGVSNQSAILNSVPYLSALSSNIVRVGNLMNITAIAVDGDNESVTLTYQFTNLNDSTILQNFSSNNTYSVELTDAHDVIEVRVNTTDGFVNVSNTINVSVLNSLPDFNLTTWTVNESMNSSFNLSLYSSDADNDNLTFGSANSTNITVGVLNGDNYTITPDVGFAGVQAVNITINDGYNLTVYQVNVTVVDLISPSVTINTPTAAQNFTATKNFTLNYTITDNGPLDSCWYTSTFDSGASLNCSNDFLNFTEVANGNHTLNVFANDTNGNQANDTVAFTINVNTAPSVTFLNLTPTIAYTFTNLSCNFTFSDNEHTNLTANYTWFRNGLAMINGTSAVTNGTLTELVLYDGNTTKGEIWSCSVFPTDGTLNGTAVNSSNVTILNSLPNLDSNISDLNWAQNTNASFNISTYFSDADSDPLNFSNSSVSNFTFYINNASGNVTIEPDAGFVGIATVTFTATDGTNSTASNSVTLSVGLSEVINSTINGTYYASGNFSNITGILTSTVVNSTVDGNTIDIKASNITRSTITNSTVNICDVIDTTLVNTFCDRSYIDPSDVRNSNITGSIVLDSVIWESNATNSNVNNTSIYNSSISNSNMTNANLTNVTMTSSNVINSTFNNTVVENANVTNDVLYGGTMLMTNGTVYNATASGQQNLTGLVNHDPVAGISSPANASSFTPGSNVSINSSATDANIGTFLNDSLTYFWDFGDGSNSTDENTSHVYGSEGTFNLTLTVTDSYNISDSLMYTLTVANAPVSPPSSGGGGSGGSTPTVSRVTLAYDEVVVLKTGTYVLFDFGGVDHRANLESVHGTFVKVKVQSEPKTVLIDLGKSAKVDVNDDGYYDVEIIAQEIKSTSAKLQFKLIFEEVPKTDEGTSDSGTGDSEGTEGGESVEVEAEKVSLWSKIVSFFKKDAGEAEDEVEEGNVSAWKSLTGKVSSGWDATKGKTKSWYTGSKEFVLENLTYVIITAVLVVLLAAGLLWRFKDSLKKLKFWKKEKKYGTGPLKAKSKAKAGKPKVKFNVKAKLKSAKNAVKGSLISGLEKLLKKLKR